MRCSNYSPRITTPDDVIYMSEKQKTRRSKLDYPSFVFSSRRGRLLCIAAGCQWHVLELQLV